MIETKASAARIAEKLDELISVPKPLRIHWTGCPNSCGQARLPLPLPLPLPRAARCSVPTSNPNPNPKQVQCADIGLMGGPAKKLNPETGKTMAVPGVQIFVGGRIGEDARL